MSGYIIHETNKRIVIASGFDRKSENIKTGPMIQIYILVKQENPVTASKLGLDSLICGDCKHKPTMLNTCYVTLFQGPYAIYNSWKQGLYKPLNNYNVFNNQLIRFGAYGDPVFIPYKIVEKIVNKAKNHTGYTHQWQYSQYQKYRKFFMASVDSELELDQAHSLGWRTFRVKLPNLPILSSEISCPASEEMNKIRTCSTCLACNGLGSSTNQKRSIVIDIHGLDYKKKKFENFVSLESLKK